MLYLKAFLTAVIAAILVCALYVLAVFVLPIFLPLLWARMTGAGGAAGASITSDSVLAVGVVAFAAAFYWRVRKGRARS